MRNSLLGSGRLIVRGILLAAGGSLLVVGCALTLGQLTVSDLDYVPRMTVAPVLKMGEHLKRKIGCVDCHEGAKKKALAGMPGRELCADCHDEVDKPEVKKKLVLGGPIFDAKGKPKWAVVTSLAADVSFSHAKHTKDHECAECHGDIEHDEYGLVAVAAKYDNCRRCHLEQESSGNCTACHSVLEKSSRPHSHDRRWPREHGMSVRNVGGLDLVSGTCNSCHSTSSCVKCHREEKPRDHTLFFTRAAHGLAADISRERCAACHTQDSCVRCHLDGATPRPGVHPVSSCRTCHIATKSGHIVPVVTDNCMFCHK
jgi:predicted CXXCH cytochrome family protein